MKGVLLMNHIFHSIKTRFLIITLTFVIVAVACISLIVILEENSNALENYYQSSEEQMKLVQKNITTFYQQIDMNINMMAEHPLIQSADSSITSYANAKQTNQMTPSKNGGM